MFFNIAFNLKLETAILHNLIVLYSHVEGLKINVLRYSLTIPELYG